MLESKFIGKPWSGEQLNFFPAPERTRKKLAAWKRERRASLENQVEKTVISASKRKVTLVIAL